MGSGLLFSELGQTSEFYGIAIVLHLQNNQAHSCATGAVCRGRDCAPARLSTQPSQGAAQGVAGRRVGGRSTPAGQGSGLLLPQLLPQARRSQIQCIPECFQGQEEKQGRDFPIPILIEGEKNGGRNLIGSVSCEHSPETRKFFLNQLFLIIFLIIIFNNINCFVNSLREWAFSLSFVT